MNRRMTRRKFVAGAAAAGAGLLFASPTLAQPGGRPNNNPGRGQGRWDDEDESAPEPEPDPKEDGEESPVNDPEQDEGEQPEPEEEEPKEFHEDEEPFKSIQAAVDNAEPGDTIIVPPGIYRETVWIWKPITLIGEPGAEIRGDDENGDIVRNHWIMGTYQGHDVVIDGFTMRYSGGGASSGGISNMGLSNWTIQNCVMSHAGGAVVSLHSADNLKLIDCEISHGGQLGVHMGSDGTARPTNVLVQDCVIHNNNRFGFNQWWEAGGIKATVADFVTVVGCEVYDNAGPGIWFDIACQGIEVNDNNVYRNTRMGIYFEVSGGEHLSRIHHNACWHNGGLEGWAMNAGIVVQNSHNVEVFDNVVAWNESAITVFQSNRTDHPDYQDSWGIRVHDNTMAVDGDGGGFSSALWWAETNDSRRTLFAHASNHGSNNAYYFINTDNVGAAYHWDHIQYAWDDIRGFTRSQGENNGVLLSQSDAQQTLQIAGVPTLP